MADFYYVNIYNEGRIPWLQVNGPLFEYKVGAGLLAIISRDSRLNIEILKTKEQSEAGKKRYYEEKRKKEEEKSHFMILNEIPTVPIKDDMTERFVVSDAITIESTPTIKEEVEEKDKDDVEIDKLLVNDKFNYNDTEAASLTTNINKYARSIKVYSDEELNQLTRSEMKKILAVRGYTSGPYAGKYHDTAEILRTKIKNTQKNK